MPTPTPSRPASKRRQSVRKRRFYSSDMSEFILPYNVVRQADQPEEMLLTFLQSTYEAAANLEKWDRGLSGAAARFVDMNKSCRTPH